MVKNIGKKEMVLATGAGVGLVQAYLTRDVLDAMWGPIPYIGDYLGVWGTYSTFGNIAIGAVTFGLSTFTGVVKNETARAFLQGYGFTTLLGGIFNGIFPNLTLKARLGGGRMRAGAPPAVVRMGPQTSQFPPRQSDILLT
jgi:hypothetical protein